MKSFNHGGGFDLDDSVNDTLDTMCNRIVSLYDIQAFESAAALLGEWTCTNDDNVLTKHLQYEVETVQENLMWMSIVDGELIYGEFTFSEDELPFYRNQNGD